MRNEKCVICGKRQVSFKDVESEIGFCDECYLYCFMPVWTRLSACNQKVLSNKEFDAEVLRRAKWNYKYGVDYRQVYKGCFVKPE